MSEEDEVVEPLSEAQMEALEEAVFQYERSLTPEAAKYLTDRGIEEGDATRFRLGLVSNPLPGHGHYDGMLAIPYLDRNGRPLTIRYRCIEEHDHREFFHGKYNSMAGEMARLYNVSAIFQAGDEIHVTEGEFDAIILSKIGLPAVAVPGARLWKPRHRRMLAGFSRVWVWGDPDDAGAEMVQKITKSLRQARGVRLKYGDITDTYTALGEDALLGLVETREEAA